MPLKFYDMYYCGLYNKSIRFVIYDHNDSTIVIYNPNDSGHYYKTINYIS
jgi:hypothetical protein